jgi:hypothetical protein
VTLHCNAEGFIAASLLSEYPEHRINILPIQMINLMLANDFYGV